jgi:hypothetical protein
MSDHREPIRFETKIAVLLREDLAGWQLLNVTAFLSSAIAGGVDGVLGEPYVDASDVSYLPMFRQPVVVLAGGKDVLAAAHGRASERGLPMSIFTADLFHTGNDRDNRAAVRAAATPDLDLVGLAVYGPRNAIDKVLKGARMHP